MAEIERYLESNSSSLHPALLWLEEQTNLRTSHARMLSGPVVGSFLKTFCELMKPDNVLELGTFTGYSAISIALGLSEGGHLDALEMRDIHRNLIEEGFRRAGVESKISLIFGDAKEIIPKMGKKYDLIYIDANKREYPEYYHLCMDILRPGGYIIADNVLWDGKVYADNPPKDKQTAGILEFNRIVKEDPRVENYILPLRRGLNIIKKL